LLRTGVLTKSPPTTASLAQAWRQPYMNQK